MALITHIDTKDHYNVEKENQQWKEFSFHLEEKIYSDKRYEITKRLMDITVSFCVVIFVLVWLVPVIALCITLSYKGPIFRPLLSVGKSGKKFYALKFRTTYHHFDDDLLQTTENDLRTAPFGRFLRMTNIDELPLFINILAGDMSLVGPRLQSLIYASRFGLSEQYMLRFAVKPGVASLSIRQNNDRYGHAERWGRDRVRYDAFYVRKRSIMLDLEIMLLNLRAMMTGYDGEW